MVNSFADNIIDRCFDIVVFRFNFNIWLWVFQKTGIRVQVSSVEFYCSALLNHYLCLIKEMK